MEALSLDATRADDARRAVASIPQDQNHRRRIEVLLTALTLAFLLASVIAEKTAAPNATGATAAPATLIVLLNLAAYLAGGFFGVIDSLPALRNRRLDINFLMVLA